MGCEHKEVGAFYQPRLLPGPTIGVDHVAQRVADLHQGGLAHFQGSHDLRLFDADDLAVGRLDLLMRGGGNAMRFKNNCIFLQWRA